MKTQNRIVLSLLAAGLALGLANSAKADGGDRGDAWQFLEAPVSSGLVGGIIPPDSTVKRTVRAIFASSNTASTPTNWFVLLDTPGSMSATDITAFATGTYRSPPMFFPVSTVTANSAMNQSYYKVMDYGPEGVNFSSGCYVLKSTTTVGLANRVYLQMR